MTGSASHSFSSTASDAPKLGGFPSPPSSPVDSFRYVVITPIRNEEAYLPYTLASMYAQTLKPQRWILVDDGSSDRTGALIEEAAAQHPWITALHRPDRGARKQGGGVVETFNDGLAHVTTETWDFLVKFDGDLSFPPDYFARCLQEFARNPKLGIGGGLICRKVAGELVCESPADPAFHVRGATKIYRRECWDAIGGLVPAPGWDGIDELKANMLGWQTRTFRHLPVHHHRFTGTADGSWRNAVKFGLANYISGYHPLFMAAKCVSRLFRRPMLIGSAGLLWGFFRGYLTRVPRISDRVLIRYVRRQQLNKILFRRSLW